MAISAIGEGCEKQMVSVLEEVVNYVLPFCHDEVIGHTHWVWVVHT